MYVNIYGVSKNEYETKIIKELYSGENGQIFQMMQFFYFCNVMYDIKVLYGLDTHHRNYIDFSFNAYFVDKYTAKFKHDILDLLIKYAVNEEYA